MDIKQSYFQLFDLPQEFEIDQNELSQRFRDLQRTFHPDKYAQKSEQEQRLALQYSSFVNEAYQVLSSPVRRAEYLLQLNGVERDQSKTLSSDPEFLMQQIEWREAIAEIRQQPDPEAEVDKLNKKARYELQLLEQSFIAHLDSSAFGKASVDVDKMHFIVKLLHEIELIEDELLDY